jgi:hypothetical protein
MYYIISLLDLLLAILATLFESTKLILLVLLLVFYYLCLILQLLINQFLLFKFVFQNIDLFL